MVPSEPRDRHRLFAGVFSARVEATQDWDAPAPVTGWVARDVVDHLVTWFPGFLAMGSDVRLPAGPAAAGVVIALSSPGWAIAVDAGDGMINKFQGDAALAVFGAPFHTEGAASAALATARTLGEQAREALVAGTACRERQRQIELYDLDARLFGTLRTAVRRC